MYMYLSLLEVNMWPATSSEGVDSHTLDLGNPGGGSIELELQKPQVRVPVKITHIDWPY